MTAAVTDICLVGSAMTDLVARVERLPEPGETLFGSSFSQGFGGKGANQAVMAARLGARVTAVVKLGDDAFGRSIRENFEAQGVDTTFVSVVEGEPSGTALITVDEASGQNVIVIVLGANSTLSEADVEAAGEAVRRAKVLVAQLETPLSATLAAFRLAKEGQTLTILNPAPAARLPAALLALTDILIPNEVEAGTLLGKPVTTLEEAVAASQALLALGPKTVIITLGSRGALVAQAGQPPQHLGAERVEAVDTTGAGDAFVGALAYFLACVPELPLLEAARRSVRIASYSVLREGAQTSFPQRADVAEELGA